MVMMVAATLCCMIEAKRWTSWKEGKEATKPGLRWPWREAKEATSAQAIEYKKQFKPLSASVDVNVNVDTAARGDQKVSAEAPVPEPVPEPNQGVKGMNPQWFTRHNK